MSDDILRDILILSNYVRRYLHSKDNEFNISGAQVRILHLIDDEEKCGNEVTQKSVELAFNLKKSSVSELIHMMMDNNLIVKVVSDVNPNKKVLKMTEYGKQICEATLKNIEDMKKMALKNIDKDKLENSIEVLDLIKTNMEDDEKYGKN